MGADPLARSTMLLAGLQGVLSSSFALRPGSGDVNERWSGSSRPVASGCAASNDGCLHPIHQASGECALAQATGSVGRNRGTESSVELWN